MSKSVRYDSTTSRTVFRISRSSPLARDGNHP